MKFFAAAALFAGALAVPTNNNGGGNSPLCPAGLLSNPVCCSTLVLGVLGLECAPPSGETPRDGRNFSEICAKKGQQAACCAIPIAGQGVLCSAVVGA